jgi:predicted ATPase with chaperone activity
MLTVTREPMESRRIHIARASHEPRYPARFRKVLNNDKSLKAREKIDIIIENNSLNGFL